MANKNFNKQAVARLSSIENRRKVPSGNFSYAPRRNFAIAALPLKSGAAKKMAKTLLARLRNAFKQERVRSDGWKSLILSYGIKCAIIKYRIAKRLSAFDRLLVFGGV